MSKNIEYANAIRALSMDAVQKANSGHPGMPMGMADIAAVLWQNHLKHNPTNPAWVNRDRFVISNGHGSMLLYSLLHLTGYDLSIDELKNFRQLHSKTPGHPEYGVTPGVETTTGPLGQGVANAVGMAIAEKTLAADFNKPDHELIDHYTYVFLGDGCLMEGISHEVCSLAGTLGLNKLILFYDDNGISIDSEKGDIANWFSDDTPGRFEAYGWNVVRGVDGHDPDQIDAAIIKAKGSVDKPTLVCCKTIIGKGSPKKQNTGASHGAPLGEEEIVATRAAIGWSYAPFEIPDSVYAVWDAKTTGQELEDSWAAEHMKYQSKYPDLSKELNRRLSGEAPEGWSEKFGKEVKDWNDKGDKLATRKASQNALEYMGPLLPELIGGSADLAASNLTMWSGSNPISRSTSGNYLFYGVREFGMAGIMNGLALHGGFIPYGATFLVFSDYSRPAIRLSALMKQRTIHVLTHDSIGLGEDGPTHQPVEHLSALRVIPNTFVFRPADAIETLECWQLALKLDTAPSVLALTRQGLPTVRTYEERNVCAHGAYELAAGGKDPQVTLMASGSEISIAMEAREKLEAEGIGARVVSVPCMELFEQQSAATKADVLGNTPVRIAVEAAMQMSWDRYLREQDIFIGMDDFGASAPAPQLFQHFGITADAVIAAARKALA